MWPRAWSLAAAVILAIAGCRIEAPPGVRGNGVYLSENRSDTIAPFDRVSLDSSANVEITVDPSLATPAVVVSADENLLGIIRTEVRDSRLHIRSERSHSSRNGVLVEIIVPSLSATYIRGSGNMYARNIEAQSFQARISGSGQMTLSGRASQADYAVTGSGSIIAGELEAAAAAAHIGGSGNISLFASEDARLSISGSGGIACYGHPARVNRNVSGSGYISVP